MELTWTYIYAQIKATVSNLDALELLYCRTARAIAVTYQADCLLWIGLAKHLLDDVWVYGTLDALKLLESVTACDRFTEINDADQHIGTPIPIGRVQVRVLPTWVQDQLKAPQLMQLTTGEVIVPISTASSSAFSQQSSFDASLQFILQLDRSPIEPVATTNSTLTTASIISGWSAAELESIAVISSQFSLAYSALFWRQQLEQSRQHAALIGRIAHLLNSCLNPNQMVQQIVTELGTGFQCDRVVLIDLRYSRLNVLATWDCSDKTLPPLQAQTDPTAWQNISDLFLNSGASYLLIHATESDLLQPWLNALGGTSALLMPLSVQEDFFGIIGLFSYTNRQEYQIGELQAIRQVTDQIAIALNQAQHYRTLWHKQEALRLQTNVLQLEVIQDELTQLRNRQSLDRELEQLSTKAVWAVQSPFSVILCDIDYLKLVNDTYGHLIGNEVLQAVACRLQNQLRRETPAYRYGGEEFAVVLMETPLAMALDVAERLRRAVRVAAITTTAGTIDITASFGVAQQKLGNDQQAWDVMQRAYQALYEAKRQGRDRVISL